MLDTITCFWVFIPIPRLFLPATLEFVHLDIGTRDDHLDHSLAAWALALPVDVERLWCLLKGKAVGDEGLEVDLALAGKGDTKLVVRSYRAVRCMWA